MFPNLYILPGKTRDSDRVVAVAETTLRTLAGPGTGVEVTFGDGTSGVFPSVVPCLHRPQWTDLESFESYTGRKVVMGKPFHPAERLASRISNGYVAFCDGSVFEREYVSRETECLRRLPCIAQIPRTTQTQSRWDDDCEDEHADEAMSEAP